MKIELNRKENIKETPKPGEIWKQVGPGYEYYYLVITDLSNFELIRLVLIKSDKGDKYPVPRETNFNSSNIHEKFQKVSDGCTIEF